jgi:ATP-dependent DNA helicase RecG
VVLGLRGGRVEGIRSASNKQNEWRQAAADFTLPTVPARPRVVECVNDVGKTDALFVVDVEPSDRVHSNQKDEVYLRVGNENRRLTFGQRQELLYDKGQASYEVTPVADAADRDLDQDLLASYTQAVNHPDSARLLRARGLIDRRDNSRSQRSCSSPSILSDGSRKPASGSFGTAAHDEEPEPASSSSRTSG